MSLLNTVEADIVRVREAIGKVPQPGTAAAEYREAVTRVQASVKAAHQALDNIETTVIQHRILIGLAFVIGGFFGFCMKWALGG